MKVSELAANLKAVAKLSMNYELHRAEWIALMTGISDLEQAVLCDTVGRQDE